MYKRTAVLKSFFTFLLISSLLFSYGCSRKSGCPANTEQGTSDLKKGKKKKTKSSLFPGSMRDKMGVRNR